MRKSRVRMLRVEFLKRFGRLPNKINIVDAERGAYIPSELRRLKKGWMEARRGAY